MTETEQRVACALACGWTGLNENCLDDCVCFNPKGVMCDGAPDYPNDLNAMHHAWDVGIKDREEDKLFAKYLRQIACPDKCNSDECSWVINATAAQRAEAFLKTKGLWK